MSEEYRYGLSLCYHCHLYHNREDMADGITCYVCYCAYMSVRLSEPQKNGIMHKRIKGITSQRSRFIHVQVKKMLCAECGERMFVSCDHFRHGVRLLQLNCRGMHQHSWYAFVSPTAHILQVYKTGDWAWSDGSQFERSNDIPF